MFSKIIVLPKYFPVSWCDNVNNYILNNIDPNPNLGKKGVRKCTVRCLWPEHKAYGGVFKSIIDLVKQYQKDFNVDLDYQIDGSIQHITYNPGDVVGWHDDTMNYSGAINNPQYNNLTINRKLSLTIMLSDPSEFTGGEFVFEQGVPVNHKMENKGTVALFTSHSPHKVEEITSGVRHILFVFLTGPEWR